MTIHLTAEILNKEYVHASHVACCKQHTVGPDIARQILDFLNMYDGCAFE